MRFLPPTALALVLALAACDSAPEAAGPPIALNETKEFGVLQSYDVGDLASFDLEYNVWQNGSQGAHSVAFIDDDDKDIIEYFYAVGPNRTLIYARWPGIDANDGTLRIEFEDKQTYVGDIQTNNPGTYTPIMSSLFSGSSIHIKPDEMRVDNDLADEGPGDCTPTTRSRREVMRIVDCDVLGLEFAVPHAFAHRVEIRGDVVVSSFDEESVEIETAEM